MARKLRRVGLDESFVRVLASNGIHTCKDVLCKRDVELMHLLDVSQETAKTVLSCVSDAIFPQVRTCFDLLSSQGSFKRAYPTTIAALDTSLNGGIHSGHITEIAGTPGVGKTQMCMSLMASVLLHSEESSPRVIIIDADNSFSPERMEEILTHRGQGMMEERRKIAQEALERVIVFRVQSSADLTSRLLNLEDTIILQNVKLIVLDSLVSATRRDADIQINSWSDSINKQAALLKYLAETFSIPVVVTNHVWRKKNQDVFDFQCSSSSTNVDYTSERKDNDFKMVASLGTAWSHCATTRLFLCAASDPEELGMPIGQTSVIIEKSPLSPNITVPFAITECGVSNPH